MQHPFPFFAPLVRRWLSWLVVAAVFLAARAEAETVVRKNVLYLNSYQNGYQWSDEILQGIREGLAQSTFNVDLQIEYMPDQNGLELARHIAELAPNLPVILVSGRLGDIEDKKLAGNIRKIVLKPYNQAIISAAIREVLDAKPQTKAACTPRATLPTIPRNPVASPCPTCASAKSPSSPPI